MPTFTVTTTLKTEAETAEEAALLMYRALSRGSVPIDYLVTGQSGTTTVVLDREKADEYAVIDHTADPGNW
ncbi:hypothetical protein [Rhizobium sp. GN54]|uniref:hypothetical protein n=1 Tax=Rhizobium sp. GN54 TaxID=2898150 RepID=UPI001E59CA73|nr:hypothetical protein [Rhizobium sp. GN54]MCD2182694.1 hypothetical protein [Rhizobium sp. GN54]